MNRYFAENSYLLDVQSEMQIGIWTIELLEDGTYVMYPRPYHAENSQCGQHNPTEGMLPGVVKPDIYDTHRACTSEMQRAMAGEEVEVVYPWVSPEKGLIYVRVGAEGTVCIREQIYGYCHDITKKNQ